MAYLGLSADWWNRYQAVVSVPQTQAFLERLKASDTWDRIIKKARDGPTLDVNDSYEVLQYYALLRNVPATDARLRVYGHVDLEKIEDNYEKSPDRLRLNEDPNLKTNLTLDFFQPWVTGDPVPAEGEDLMIQWTIPVGAKILIYDGLVMTFPHIRLYIEAINTRSRSAEFRGRFEGFLYNSIPGFFYNLLDSSLKADAQLTSNLLLDEIYYYLQYQPQSVIFLKKNGNYIAVTHSDANIHLGVIPTYHALQLRGQDIADLQEIKVGLNLITFLRTNFTSGSGPNYRIGKWFVIRDKENKTTDERLFRNWLDANQDLMFFVSMTKPMFVLPKASDFFSRIISTSTIDSETKLSPVQVAGDTNLFRVWQDWLIVEDRGLKPYSRSQYTDYIPLEKVNNCPCPYTDNNFSYGIMYLAYDYKFADPSEFKSNEDQLYAKVLQRKLEEHRNEDLNYYNYHWSNVLLRGNKIIFVNINNNVNFSSEVMSYWRNFDKRDIMAGVHPSFNNRYLQDLQFSNMFEELNISINPLIDQLNRFEDAHKRELNVFMTALSLLADSVFARQEMLVVTPKFPKYDSEEIQAAARSDDSLIATLTGFYRAADQVLATGSAEMEVVDRAVQRSILVPEVFNVMMDYAPKIGAAWARHVKAFADLYDNFNTGGVNMTSDNTTFTFTRS